MAVITSTTSTILRQRARIRAEAGYEAPTRMSTAQIATAAVKSGMDRPQSTSFMTEFGYGGLKGAL